MVTGSTQLQKLPVRSILVFNSASGGHKLVSAVYRMCMECTCKLASLFMINAWFLELIYGQRAASKCCTGLLSSQYLICQISVFNQMHMPLNCTRLMGLSNTGSCAGPLRDAVPVA
eukprot:1160792-Pelagomonas_calceolata.AAC.1